MLDGTALDELIDALITDHQASQLAAMESMPVPEPTLAERTAMQTSLGGRCGGDARSCAQAGVEGAGDDARLLAGRRARLSRRAS